MTQPGPNPQTNLIFSIVAPVVALIAVAVIYFTKPIPSAIAAPAPVNVASAKLPADSVVTANALPGASSASGPAASSGGGPGGAPGGPGKKMKFQGMNGMNGG